MNRRSFLGALAALVAFPKRWLASDTITRTCEWETVEPKSWSKPCPSINFSGQHCGLYEGHLDDTPDFPWHMGGEEEYPTMWSEPFTVKVDYNQWRGVVFNQGA